MAAVAICKSFESNNGSFNVMNTNGYKIIVEQISTLLT